MGNPVIDDADDEVEMSFYEWIDSSPYNGIIIGVTLSSLIFTVFLSLFLRYQTPTDAQVFKKADRRPAPPQSTTSKETKTEEAPQEAPRSLPPAHVHKSSYKVPVRKLKTVAKKTAPHISKPQIVLSPSRSETRPNRRPPESFSIGEPRKIIAEPPALPKHKTLARRYKSEERFLIKEVPHDQFDLSDNSSPPVQLGKFYGAPVYLDPFSAEIDQLGDFYGAPVRLDEFSSLPDQLDKFSSSSMTTFVSSPTLVPSPEWVCRSVEPVRVQMPQRVAESTASVAKNEDPGDGCVWKIILPKDDSFRVNITCTKLGDAGVSCELPKSVETFISSLLVNESMPSDARACLLSKSRQEESDTGTGERLTQNDRAIVSFPATKDIEPLEISKQPSLNTIMLNESQARNMTHYPKDCSTFRHTRQSVVESRNNGTPLKRADNDETLLPTRTALGTCWQGQASATRKNVLLSGQISHRAENELRGGGRRKIETIRMSSSSSWSAVEEDLDMFRTCNEMTNPLKSDEERKRAAHDEIRFLRGPTLPYGQNDDDLVLLPNKPKNAARPGIGIKHGRPPSKPSCFANRTGVLQASANLLPGVRIYASKDDSSRKRKQSTGSSMMKDDRHVLGKTSNAVQSSTSSDDSAMSVLLYPNSNKKQSDEHLRITYRPRSAAKLTSQPVPTFMLKNTGNQSQCCNRRGPTKKALAGGRYNRRMLLSKRDVNGNKLSPANIFDCTAELREIIQVTMKDLERYNPNIPAVPCQKVRKDYDKGGNAGYHSQDSSVVRRSSYKSKNISKDAPDAGESRTESQSGYELMVPSVSHWTKKEKEDNTTDSASTSTKPKSQSMPRRSSRVDKKHYDSRFRVKLKKSMKAMLGKGRNVSITSINSYSACLTLSRHSGDPGESSSSHTTDNLKRSVYKSPCFYFMDPKEERSFPIDNLLSNEHYVCLNGEYPKCLKASFATKAKGAFDHSFDRSANYHEDDDRFSQSWVISDSDQHIDLPVKSAVELLSLSGSDKNKLSSCSSEDQNIRSQEEPCRFRDRHQNSYKKVSRKADVIVPKNGRTFLNSKKKPRLSKLNETKKHASELDDRCSETESFEIEPISADSTELSSNASGTDPYDMSVAFSFRKYLEKPKFEGKITTTKSKHSGRKRISESSIHETDSNITDTLSSHKWTTATKVKVSHLESASMLHLGDEQSISDRYRSDRKKDTDVCSNYNYQEIECRREFDETETSPSVQISIATPYDMSQVCARVEIDSNSVQVSGVNMRRVDSKLPIIIKSRKVEMLDEETRESNRPSEMSHTHQKRINKTDCGAKYQQSKAKSMVSPSKGHHKYRLHRHHETSGKVQYRDRQRDNVKLMERYLYKGMAASVIDSIAEVSEASPCVSVSQQCHSTGPETNRNEKSAQESEKTASDSATEKEAWPENPHYVSAKASTEAVQGSDVGGKRAQRHNLRAKNANVHAKLDAVELIRSRNMKIADGYKSKHKTQFVSSELDLPESFTRHASSEREKRHIDKRKGCSVLEREAVNVTSSSRTYSAKCENIKVYQKGALNEVDQSASEESGQGSVDVCVVERSQSTREIVVKKNYIQNRSTGKNLRESSDQAGDNGRRARTSVDFDSEQISYMEIVPKQGKWRGLQLSEITEPNVAGKLKESSRHRHDECKKDVNESSTSKSSSEVICKLLILPSESASLESLPCLDIHISSPQCSTRVDSVGDPPKRKTNAKIAPSSKALPEPKHVNCSLKIGGKGPKNIAFVSNYSRAEVHVREKRESRQAKGLEYGEPVHHQLRTNFENGIKNVHRKRDESQEKRGSNQITQSKHETIQHAKRPVARVTKRYTQRSARNIASKSESSIPSVVTERHTLQRAVQTCFSKEVQMEDKDTLVVFPEFTGKKIDHVCQTEMIEPPAKVDKNIQCPTLGSQAAIELMDLLSLIQTGKQYLTQTLDTQKKTDPNAQVVKSGIRLDNCRFGCKRSPNRNKSKILKPISELSEGSIKLSSVKAELVNYFANSGSFSMGRNVEKSPPLDQKSQLGHRPSQRNTHLKPEDSSREDRPAHRKKLGEDRSDATPRNGRKAEMANENSPKIHRTQPSLRSDLKSVHGHKDSHDTKNRVHNNKAFYETLSDVVSPPNSLKDVKRKSTEVRKAAQEKQEVENIYDEVNEGRTHVHYEEGKQSKHKSERTNQEITESTHLSKPLQETELNKSIFCKHLTRTHMANYIAKLAPDTNVSDNDLKPESREVMKLDSQEVNKLRSGSRESKPKIGRQTSRASGQIKSEVGSDRLDQLLVLDSGNCSVELNNTKSEDVNLKDFIEINRGHHLVTPRGLQNESSGRVLENTETRTNSHIRANFQDVRNEKSGPQNGPTGDLGSSILNRETNAKKWLQKPADREEFAYNFSDLNKGFTLMNAANNLLAQKAESKVISCTKADEALVVCQDQDSKTAAATITSKAEKEIKIQINLNMMESRASQDRVTTDTISLDSMAFTPHRLKRLGRVGRLPVYQKRFLRRYESKVDTKLAFRERRSVTKGNSDQLKDNDQNPTEAAPAQQPETVTTPEDTQPTKMNQQTSSNGKQTNAPDVKNKKVMTSQTDSTHLVSQRKKADIYNTLLSALLLALKAPEDDWRMSRAAHSHRRHGNAHGKTSTSRQRDESDENEKAARAEKIFHSDKHTQSEKPDSNDKFVTNEKQVHKENIAPYETHFRKEVPVHKHQFVHSDRPVPDVRYTPNDKHFPNEKYVQTNEVNSGSPVRKSRLPRIRSDPSQQKSQPHDSTNTKHRYSNMLLSSIEPETINYALKGFKPTAGPPSSTHSPRKSKIPVMKPELRAKYLKNNVCRAINRSSLRGTPLSTKNIASNASLSVRPRAESKRNASDLNSTIRRSVMRPLSRQVPDDSGKSRDNWAKQKPVSSSEPTPQPQRRRMRNIRELPRDVNSSKTDRPYREYWQDAQIQRGTQQRLNYTDGSVQPEDRNQPDSNASRGNRWGKPASSEKKFGTFHDQLRVRKEKATRDDGETDGEKHGTLSHNTSLIPFTKKDQGGRTNAQRRQRRQKMPPGGFNEQHVEKKDIMESNVERLKSRRLGLESLAQQRMASEDFLNVNGCRTLYIGLDDVSKLPTSEFKENFKSRGRRSPDETFENTKKPRTFTKLDNRQIVPRKFSEQKRYFTSKVGLDDGGSSPERYIPAKHKGGAKTNTFRKAGHLKADKDERLRPTRKKARDGENVLFSTASSPPTKPQFSPPCANLSSSNHHCDTSDDISATVAFDHAGSLAHQLEKTRTPRPETTGRRTRTAQQSKRAKTGQTKRR